MENYKIKGKTVQMPTGWHDIIYQKGIEIYEKNLTGIDLFCHLTSLDKKFVRSLKDPKTIERFMYGFPFLSREDFKPEMPQSVYIKKQLVPLPFVMTGDPFDMGEMAVGQIEDMKAYISKEFSEDKLKDLSDREKSLASIKAMPMLCAIYLQPLLEPKDVKEEDRYDYKKALSLVHSVKKDMSYKEVSCMGSFFFKKLHDSVTGSKDSSQKFKRMTYVKRKWRQVWRRIIMRLASI
jgi:hypothetical protein